MLKLYYEIWVDCIIRLKKFDEDWWQYKTIAVMTFWLGIAFLIIMSILQNFIFKDIFYSIDLQPYFSKPIAQLFEYLILYNLPFLMINYFLIFYKNKYEKLI